MTNSKMFISLGQDSVFEAGLAYDKNGYTNTKKIMRLEFDHLEKSLSLHNNNFEPFNKKS